MEKQKQKQKSEVKTDRKNDQNNSQREGLKIELKVEQTVEQADEQIEEIAEEPVINTMITQTNELQEAASALFRIPIFFSHQGFFRLDELRQMFLVRMFREIKRELLFPRTLPTTEQYPDPTFESIRRMILSSYGMAAALLQQITGPTTPYLQIEPSMAFQHGLPLLLVKEASVIEGGVWTDTPFHVVEWFSQDTTVDEFFDSAEWREVIQNWGAEVRNGYYMQTQPQFNYRCY